jgi:hypothetical protein
VKFQFRAFYGPDNLSECIRFHQGHTKVLEDLGIENLTSNVQPWMEDPNQIILVAEDEENELVGGIRIQTYKSGGRIPLTDALASIDDNIFRVLDNQASRGTAESCGLWNSKKVYGLGLSRLLAQCSVSLAATLECQTLFCFSAPYTYRMISALGFIPVEEIGDKGKVLYPSEKFVSTVLWIPDLYTLSHADALQRERIFSLMTQPKQVYFEVVRDQKIEIEYNLIKEIAL